MLPVSPSHLTFESIQNFLAFFVFFWLIAIVCHHLFCRKFQWYQNQVQNGAIQVSFGRLYLTSHYLNGPIQAVGSWPRLVRLWRCWFIVGVLVSSALLIPVLAFLVYLLVGHVQRIVDIYHRPLPTTQTLSTYTTTSTSSISLTPMIPGVNLPVSSTIPFFISVLFSTFIHELGHGISAASELTEVGGVGVALIGVFPAAFVVIKNLDNQALSRQLRIMAAGVWHNLVLAALAGLLLWNLPAVVQTLYTSGKSVTVLAVNEQAIQHQPPLFHHGVEIFGVNNCSVHDTRSLETCSLSHNKTGFCLSPSAIKQSRGDFLPPPPSHFNYTATPLAVECCQNTSASLCFYDTSTFNSECLQITPLFASNSTRCNSSSDCQSTAETCFLPHLSEREGFLIVNTSTGPLLFVGDVLSLLRNLRVTNLSTSFFWPLWLPNFLEVTLKYFVSISLALAVLNLVPCLGLDGQHFFAIWVELLFRYHFLPAGWADYQMRIIQITTIGSTFLLAADVLLGFLAM